MKSQVCPLAAGCIGKAAAGFRSPGGCASVEAVFTKPCAQQYIQTQKMNHMKTAILMIIACAFSIALKAAEPDAQSE
jgi:hypothetical protein